MSKFKFVLIFMFVVFALTSCADSSNERVSLVGSETLAGAWESQDGDMTADVTDNSITIFWISDDSKSLYWKGTFDASKDVNVSKADTKALDASLLGSQSSEKTFSYEDDELTFSLSVMGTEKTVALKKQ